MRLARHVTDSVLLKIQFQNYFSDKRRRDSLAVPSETFSNVTRYIMIVCSLSRQ